MAAIAQVDRYRLYQGLIRKIGYSVGLENLVDNVKRLVSLYTDRGEITAAAFRDLVEKDFGRTNAVEHFANFYSKLNLVRGFIWDHKGGLPTEAKRIKIPKALEPLYQLDSLSILRRLFVSDDAKYDTALKVVLTQTIIEADGDVFLNALLSDFQPSEMKLRLEAMVKRKRELLRKVIHTPGLISEIEQIVDIKNESDRDSGERTEESPVGRFARRTEALDRSRRTSQLTGSANNRVLVPADYLKKVSNSRKQWARHLGLFEKDGKTERGVRLLAQLTKDNHEGVISTVANLSTAVYWGYRSDLERMRINPNKIEASDWEAWDLLEAIARSFFSSEVLLNAVRLKADEVFSLLRSIFELYKGGSTSKGLIRNSLPLYVAEPVLVGWCVAETHALPDLAEILQVEFQKKVRRVQKMIIRGTAGALFFTKVAT